MDDDDSSDFENLLDNVQIEISGVDINHSNYQILLSEGELMLYLINVVHSYTYRANR